jgi:hypothetical protein
LGREPRHGLPEILARLRRDAEHRLDEPSAPRWSAPVGWLIALAIVAFVIVAIVTANPL